MHFYCEKLLAARNPDREELNRPLGAENVKRTGEVENLARVSTPPIP